MWSRYRPLQALMMQSDILMAAVMITLSPPCRCSRRCMASAVPFAAVVCLAVYQGAYVLLLAVYAVVETVEKRNFYVVAR